MATWRDLSELLEATQTADPSRRHAAERAVMELLGTAGGIDSVLDYIATDSPAHLRQLAVLLVRQSSALWSTLPPAMMEKLTRVAFGGVLSEQPLIRKSSVPLVTKIFMLGGDEAQSHVFSVLKHNLAESEYHNGGICSLCLGDIFEEGTSRVQERMMLSLRDEISGVLSAPFDPSSPARMDGALGVVRLTKLFFTELGNIRMSVGLDALDEAAPLMDTLQRWPEQALWVLEQNHHLLLDCNTLRLTLPVYIEIFRTITTVIGAFSNEVESLFDRCIDSACRFLEMVHTVPSFKSHGSASQYEGDLYDVPKFEAELFEIVNCIMTVSQPDFQTQSHLSISAGVASFIQLMVQSCVLPQEDLSLWTDDPSRFISDIELDEDDMSCTTRHICAQMIRMLCKRYHCTGKDSVVLNSLEQLFERAVSDPAFEAHRKSLFIESVLWVLQHASKAICKKHIQTARQCRSDGQAVPPPRDEPTQRALDFISTRLFPLVAAGDVTDPLLASRTLYSACQFAALYPTENLLSMLQKCVEMGRVTTHVGLRLQTQRCLLILFQSCPVFCDLGPAVSADGLSTVLDAFIAQLVEVLPHCDENTLCFPLDCLYACLKRVPHSAEKESSEALSVYASATPALSEKYISSDRLGYIVEKMLALWCDDRCDVFVLETIQVVLKRLLYVTISCRYPLECFVSRYIAFMKWISQKCATGTIDSAVMSWLEKLHDSILDVHSAVCLTVGALGSSVGTRAMLSELLSDPLQCVLSLARHEGLVSTGSVVLLLPIQLGSTVLKSIQRPPVIPGEVGATAVHISGVLVKSVLSLGPTAPIIQSLRLLCLAVVQFEQLIGDEMLVEIVGMLWTAYCSIQSAEADAIQPNEISMSRRQLLLASIIHMVARNPLRIICSFSRQTGPSVNADTMRAIVLEWTSFHSSSLLLLQHNNMYSLKLSTCGLMSVLAGVMEGRFLDEATMADIFSMVVKSVPTIAKEGEGFVDSDMERDDGSFEGGEKYYADDSYDEDYYDESDGGYDEEEGACGGTLDLSDLLMSNSNAAVAVAATPKKGKLGRALGSMSWPEDTVQAEQTLPTQLGSAFLSRDSGVVQPSVVSAKGIDKLLFSKPMIQDNFVRSSNIQQPLRDYMASIVANNFGGNEAAAFEGFPLLRGLSSTDRQVLMAVCSTGRA